jgi:hypothetical protein
VFQVPNKIYQPSLPLLKALAAKNTFIKPTTLPKPWRDSISRPVAFLFEILSFLKLRLQLVKCRGLKFAQARITFMKTTLQN